MNRSIVFAALPLFVACGGTQTIADCPVAEPCVVCSDEPACVPVPAHGNLNAVLWVQTSAEFATGSIQDFRTAELRLVEGLADLTWTAAPEQEGDFGALPPAVIMDLDETVLDNSAYQAWLVQTGQGFASDTWVEWCEAREAMAIPGALAFVQAAVDQGVTVFFVSNRPAETEQATRDNLEALGFGFAISEEFDNVLLKREQDDWGSEKGTRRIVIAETHRVVLSIGDNLGDFVDGYKVSLEERNQIVDDNMAYWGERWIVLANPTYGSWEQTLYDFDYGRDQGVVFDGKVESVYEWIP
ncbi:MAG: acid phosphatase [Bradymonadia bacterium]|jgi:acid phosphatase